MKIAEVIVSSQIKSLGRIYHYLADDDVKIGARVIIKPARVTASVLRIKPIMKES